MSTLEANLALLLTIPEERQEEIQSYLLTNFCTNNPYRLLSGDKILAELAESRACYLAGEGEDLDKVLDEIDDRYGLQSYHDIVCKRQTDYRKKKVHIDYLQQRQAEDFKVIPVPVVAWGFFYCPSWRLWGQIGGRYGKGCSGKNQEGSRQGTGTSGSYTGNGSYTGFC